MLKWMVAILICMASTISYAAHKISKHQLAKNFPSSIGFVLAGNNYSTAEQPFLNIVKTATTWLTLNSGGSDTGEEVDFYKDCIDSNGYPADLTCSGAPAHTWTTVAFRVFNGIGGPPPGVSFPYQPGHYLLRWSGDANWTVSQDASASCTTSPCDINIASPGSVFVQFKLTCTGTGCSGGTTKMTKVSFIFCGATGSPCANGADTQMASCESEIAAATAPGPVDCFNPVFLTRMMPFKSFRMMEWQEIKRTFVASWANRPLPGFVFWAGSPTNATINSGNPDVFGVGGGADDGVPAEIQFAFCNKALATYCWLNIPPLASDAYVTSFATLAHSYLGAGGPKAIVEYANELWNQALCGPSGTMTDGCEVQVGAICSTVYTAVGSSCTGSGFQTNTQYSMYAAVHFGNLWKTAWNPDGARVIRLWGGQLGNYTGYTDFWLTQNDFASGHFFSGTLGANIDAVGIAPYFGDTVISSAADAWTADADGGLAKLFQQIGDGTTQGLLSTLSTGNCVNGAGHTCSTGTAGNGQTCSTANYCFTSGLGLSGEPANDALIAAIINADSTLSGGHTFINVDNANQYPILLNDGTCPGNDISAGYLGATGSAVFVFTSATSNCSSGSITKGWRVVGNVGTGDEIKMTTALEQGNCTVIGTHGPGVMFGYESGQQFTGGASTDQPLGGLYNSANRDARMGTAYTNFYSATKSVTGCTQGVMEHYSDIFPNGTGNNLIYWGALENFQQTSSPKYDALRSFR